MLLIFDEVITGYRLGIGGAQARYGVTPDLTTLGKVVGGGLPIGVFGGRTEIMRLVAPAGPVYQAGTFSGNPLSLAAGLATVRWLKANREVYAQFDDATRALEESVGRWPGSFVRLGSLFKHFFRSAPPQNYRRGETGRHGRVSSVLGADAAARGLRAPLSVRDELPLDRSRRRRDGEARGGVRVVPLVIGTRGSALALAQTARVREQLGDAGIETTVRLVATAGDTVTGVPLHEIGGQGVFVRALDDAIRRGECDLAVHSMKDIPAKRPRGVVTAAVLHRDSPADFLVTPHAAPCVIGSSSTRRRAQLLRHDSGLDVRPIRGNVDTRLKRLAEGRYDAIVLAEAGLERLDIEVAGRRLDPEVFVPATNQGTIAVVSRDDPDARGHPRGRPRGPREPTRHDVRACRDGGARRWLLHPYRVLVPGRAGRGRGAQPRRRPLGPAGGYAPRTRPQRGPSARCSEKNPRI